ncbi:spermidine synthase [Sphaeroforma arctica JP610]|uniref:Spermidine synthase n=1 Tax=Sphaeroforma arctica JP610 TaxID=667725 RepID=A0A0L0FMS7_9EUKA|nr:spermidine synthase [Sphaeroforma arctica JP610]KNC78057.1 spermidine synthase [Sphaeroforma arctica JP610]|eukprot:XP_014151959.1 spermidine synthase [Sphaeroforma arctica JP610]
MMAHVPLFTHPNPERVLIIGGGDGGVMRECVKHPSVKEVILCDIDKMVPEVSKKYLPNMSKGFDSPKSTLYIGDGIEFMRNHLDSFDVIITDSSDPVGPAEALFTDEYYQLMKSALREGGIVCSQGECMWLHLEMLAKMIKFNKNIYPSVGYGYVCIPTYPSGQIGLLMCGKAEGTDFSTPARELTEEEVEKWELRYYNSAIHKAAFVLPEFARKVLK